MSSTLLFTWMKLPMPCASNSAILVIAGAPACMAELEAQGIGNFIHAKSNVLDTLHNYLTQMGI